MPHCTNSNRTSPARITGLILAGGRGLRFGGRDKGLLPWHGQPLVDHVIAALEPQVATLLISANRHLGSYRQRGWRVLRDDWPGSAGPLAGMLTGLNHCPGTWLLCVPCDVATLPADTARRLFVAAERDRAPAAYAVSGDDPIYPLCLLHRRLRPALTAALAGGDRAVGRFLHQCGATLAPFPAGALRNLNTPAALEAA